MRNLIKIGLRLAIIIMLIWVDVSECRATDTPRDSLTFQLLFRLDDNLLLRDYRNNAVTLDKIDQLLSITASHQVKCISIIGSASPNGNDKRNRKLAQLRAHAIGGYVRWKHPHIPHDVIRNSYVSDFLPDWQRAVEQDLNVPRRDKVRAILQTEASLVTKWANIQLLVGGPANYMERVMFPPMRSAVSCVIVLNDTLLKLQDESMAMVPVADEPVAEPTSNKPMADEPVTSTPVPEPVADEPITEPTPNKSVADEPVSGPVPEEPIAGTPMAEVQPEPQPFVSTDNTLYINKPLFALKTNLLFDAASLLNVEVEVPIGKRWSIAGEWMFPWWLNEEKQNCVQVMSGTLEGRYWLGNREVRKDGIPRQQLTGWFLGLYAGGGLYDLEWNRQGYQGEFFIAAGLSGGYSHTINKKGNLRMEYSLGIGYMQTNYRRYEAKYGADDAWHLYRRESGKFSWFGPTRAKISLVWMLDTNLFNTRGGHR